MKRRRKKKITSKKWKSDYIYIFMAMKLGILFYFDKKLGIS